MIPKNELVDQATQANLQTHVIEKDYVLGWLLAGINQRLELRESWVFKGGTCLKKCYFDTYRFSEDLDFTLRDKSHINADFLRDAFTGIVAWIYDASGIEISADRLKFEIYTNPAESSHAKGVSTTKALPRIPVNIRCRESSWIFRRMKSW